MSWNMRPQWAMASPEASARVPTCSGSRSRRGGNARSAQAGFAGSDHGLGAVGDLQLAADVRDVVADRLQTQHQLLGDVLVGAAVGDQSQDLGLALGELGKDRRARGSLRRG